MVSRHKLSLRVCLPLCTLLLEIAFILIFWFFTSYDDSSVNQDFMDNYQVIRDITVMAALGLGFLSSFPRHSWSSVAFNLFLLAVGVQWAVLLDGFLNKYTGDKMIIELSRSKRFPSEDDAITTLLVVLYLCIQLATMSTMSVLISVGAVLRKANLLQLMMMALVEVTAFTVMRMVSDQIFSVEPHTSMMHIHVFAAYFGLAVAWCFSVSVHEELQAEDSTVTGPCLLTMLGTLFLWIFWPSFNSALITDSNEKKNAVFNTYYALAVSAVTAIAASALAHPEGKINVTHIHNAVLAGGVAVGVSCHLISSPWPAMVLGLLAGLISIGGANFLPVGFDHVLMVHYTFGLPGLLGEITYIVLMALQTSSSVNCYHIFFDVGILSFIMIMSLASGFLTGAILKLKIWKTPDSNKYHDQSFWKFPHLAAGF